MEGLFLLLALLAVAALVSGPIALALSFTALQRIRDVQRQLHTSVAARPPIRPVETLAPPPEVPRVAEPVAPEAPVRAAAGGSVSVAGVGESHVAPVEDHRPAVPGGAPPKTARREPLDTATRRSEAVYEAAVPRWPQGISLEQRIGTRWVLVAGVVTVIFAVGFFLKYAYDNQWIGPLGRVLVAGAGGLIALAVGEFTRRRGYEMVAKGVTALGFAILYATVFAAHRWYELIGAAPAYVLAVGITAAAMLYAVVVDEVIVAVLSVLGGYIAPVVLSRGENLPTLLFSYVLILSAGAMLCAYWRKWSMVNVIAFLGTYLLFTGWFEKFYRPAMDTRWPPSQLGVALFWLAVFFLVFLILPVLHTLVRRVRSQVQDTVLVLANAVVVFYYLWTMLMKHQRPALALGSMGMGAVYLGLAWLVYVRYRADPNLWNSLLTAGLALVTLAVPVYYRMYAAAVVWAVEGGALTAIGLRYRSMLTQIAGGAVVALAMGRLAFELPMHTTAFRLFFNPVFGAWGLVAAALLVCHLLYRFDAHLDADVRRSVTQALYTAGLLLLLAATTMELWHYADLGFKGADGMMSFFIGRMTLVCAAFVLAFSARPLCPRGPLCPAVAAAIGATGALLLVVMYTRLHPGSSRIFVNSGFAQALVLVAALFAAAGLMHRAGQEQRESRELSMPMALAGILLLWLLLTEEVWFYYRFRRTTTEWQVLAHMYISVMWAVYATTLMVIGFWRRVRPLRYIALGIFLLLLAKIFLVDTRTLETVYRIAGFLATGLALVGVSYLYQYLKKQGFFEPIR
jgi:uncharacterized membrane protein